MKNKIRQMKGFTLVELLIVIALIAILSVAVLATINPIEQSNKARDAKFKNDAAEVMNSYERFYASQNKYPWNMDNDASGSIDNDEVAAGTNSIAFFSRDWRFGILDALGNTTNSQLISTSELKSAFAGKEPFVSTVANGTSEDSMYVYHSSDSNYVCFCPKANANRTGDTVNNLKCLSGISTSGNAAVTATILNAGDANCARPTTTEAKLTSFCTTGGAYANLLCVPEGQIN